MIYSSGTGPGVHLAVLARLESVRDGRKTIMPQVEPLRCAHRSHDRVRQVSRRAGGACASKLRSSAWSPGRMTRAWTLVRKGATRRPYGVST
jgi:hypothetical protein